MLARGLQADLQSFCSLHLPQQFASLVQLESFAPHVGALSTFAPSVEAASPRGKVLPSVVPDDVPLVPEVPLVPDVPLLPPSAFSSTGFESPIPASAAHPPSSVALTTMMRATQPILER